MVTMVSSAGPMFPRSFINAWKIYRIPICKCWRAIASRKSSISYCVIM